MKIFVATPCAHELVNSNYAATLFYLANRLARDGIETEITLLSMSDIDFSRSIFASHVLAESSFTHLLFIDSDMSFPISLVTRMIEFDRDFVGAICPRRTIDIPNIVIKARRAGADADLNVDRLISENGEYAGILLGASRHGKTDIQIDRG